MASNSRISRIGRRSFCIVGNTLFFTTIVVVSPFYLTALAVLKGKQFIDHQSRQDDRVYLKSESKHPLPLPLKRRFNLSETNLASDTDQLQSRLMALPYEIRQQIWKYVLAEGHTVDIFRSRKSKQYLSHRLHPQCRSRGPDRTNHQCAPSSNGGKMMTTVGWDMIPIAWIPCQQPRPLRRLGTVLTPALLRTCRQIYRECMSVLYSGNEFRFTNVDDISFFNQGLRRQWAARIQRISISVQLDSRHQDSGKTQDAWESAWFQIATWMTGLQHLSLVFVGSQIYDHWVMLFDVARLSGLQSCSIVLCSSGRGYAVPDDLFADFADAIAALTRRPRGEQLDRARLLRMRPAAADPAYAVQARYV